MAKKAFTADARMNDQAYLVVEDGAKTILVGDVIYDEDRAKKPAPVRTDADLDGLRVRLKQYLIGAFSVVLDPASDRKGWKGVTVKADTGYGNYPMAGWVKADDGSLLVLGRWWDRTRSVAEQRKEYIKLAGTPATGPPTRASPSSSIPTCSAVSARSGRPTSRTSSRSSARS